MAENKFPTEVVDLPSEGKFYSNDSPLKEGKIEIKYMTAKEEDILTSQNLIKKGVVIQKLMDELIVTPGVKSDDLFIGDKNAVMVAARILAYGPDYTVEITNPLNNKQENHTFNLANCPFKKIPNSVTESDFTIELPVSKAKVKYKLLTGKEEQLIDQELAALAKIGKSGEITTRLRHSIVSVNGKTEKVEINQFIDTLLSRDSIVLRQEMVKNAPDIELAQEIEIGGETVKVDIPLTADFFWPSSI